LVSVKDIYGVGTVGSENTSNLASIKKNNWASFGSSRRACSILETYLGKSKIVRKTMFSKGSLFGTR
jgi:hypothetical protein